MSPSLDMGVYGAKRQAAEDCNPRALLKKIIKSKPRASESEIFAAFVRALESSDTDYDTPIRRYWFSNNYRSMIHKPVRVSRKDVDASKLTLGGRMREFVLMDLVLPHGKKLRDSTGKECAILSKKTGAWLKRVADKVGPRAVVGNVLTEDDVRLMWR